MLQKINGKVFFTFLLCLLSSPFLLAQNKKDLSFQYKNFISTGTNAKEINFSANKYFICQATAAFILKNKNINIERQLNDSMFIISINDKSIALETITWLQPANSNWKLSQTLFSNVATNKIIYPFSALVAVYQNGLFETWAAQNKISFKNTTAKNTYLLNINNAILFNQLLASADINYIGEYNILPKAELQINSLDLGANSISLLHSKMPALNGDGLVISIKENKPDTADIDFAGRYITNPLAATGIDPHATIMATMAAGAGNSWYLGRGAAWGAGITSSNFSNLLPDADANYQQFNISVQNHSYGVGVENFYGADAAAFDASALANDKLLFVFSAGNSGTVAPTTGNYNGISGVANLTGSFKMAKNIITVGAIDSFYNVAAQSSKGPAYDGRIKPEMVAYGQDGSSGAAALVSGTAIVLQQAYKNNNGGNLPPSSLIKAVLINSCDDVAATGIDFMSGFGSLNAYQAAANLNTQKYFTGSVSNNGTQTFSINIPPNLSKIKFTLVWNDIPATANAFKALQNDLDIEVKVVSSGQVWLPWVLNSAANKDSLTLLPVRKRDSLNNTELVGIDNPIPGNYTITIKGFLVNNSAQSFAIAYQYDTANNFLWHFPVAADNIFPAASNLLRWGATFGGAVGTLDYSIDDGITWKLINNSINLSTNYFSWTAPDTNALALLRMTIGNRSFVSDTFSISAKPDFNVGFNCADSVLLYWNKSKGVNTYQLYGLGNKYLQPITQLTDTQFVFNKNNLTYLQFAVAPIIKNRIGVKSYTTNYTTQAVDCYVSTLVADLVNDKNAFIQLNLGTTYQVKKIIFEKLIAGNFITLQETASITGLGYTTTDTQLQKGLNIYRTAIYLLDGRIIYSYLVNVFYYKDDEIVLYPNPVRQYSQVTLQFKSLQNQIIKITDASGRLIFLKRTLSNELKFSANFSAGIYIITIIDEGAKNGKTLKLIVR
ncbi:MAG: S8 family peptidase [Ferruginibacter sp.]